MNLVLYVGMGFLGVLVWIGLELLAIRKVLQAPRRVKCSNIQGIISLFYQ